MGRNLLKAGFLATCIALGLLLGPAGSLGAPATGTVLLDLAAGLGVGLLGLVLAGAAGRTPLRTQVGGLAGLLAGALAAAAVGGLLSAPALPAFVPVSIQLTLLFLGTLVGAARGSRFSAAALGSLWQGGAGERHRKILDTSVIIDGRIADICETGFLEGRIVVPQFVLDELQAVADSPDGLKRNRGRKGLDILQRLQRHAGLDVEIVDRDFPKIREVDQKLIALAKEVGGKIVTNDFNLNQVAQLHGLDVLNINDLANSLKPVVLPGETLQVFILKEGKEDRQGVAYLDDGTMVVVDNARNAVGSTIPVTITSVLQTTVGKMFFARYDAPGGSHAPRHGREGDAGRGG